MCRFLSAEMLFMQFAVIAIGRSRKKTSATDDGMQWFWKEARWTPSAVRRPSCTAVMTRYNAVCTSASEMTRDQPSFVCT